MVEPHTLHGWTASRLIKASRAHHDSIPTIIPNVKLLHDTVLATIVSSLCGLRCPGHSPAFQLGVWNHYPLHRIKLSTQV